MARSSEEELANAVLAADESRVRAERRVALLEAEIANLSEQLTREAEHRIALQREIEELKKGR